MVLVAVEWFSLRSGMQRQQTQAQMESLANLGAAKVAKTTYDARDFQTKAFSKMKGFKVDEKACPDWRYKFRVEASRFFRQTAAILDWAEDRTYIYSTFFEFLVRGKRNSKI